MFFRIFCALTFLMLVSGVTPTNATVYQVLYRGADAGFDLSFLPDKQQICSFTAIFIDNDNLTNLEIRLLRRTMVPGRSLASFDRPQTIATITTEGAAEGVQKQSAPNISSPTVNTRSYFYSWDFSFVGDNAVDGVQMLGLQIDIRPQCT